MKQSIYTPAFKEQALVKLYSRGSRTIRAVAEEIQLNYHTAKSWMKAAEGRSKSGNKPVIAAASPEKRPQDWSIQERLRALQATYNLTEQETSAWCRSHGLFAHHLTAWQAEFCAKPVAIVAAETRALQIDNQRLKTELARKEKALAEAAALLVLQKKFRALWEDEGK